MFGCISHNDGASGCGSDGGSRYLGRWQVCGSGSCSGPGGGGVIVAVKGIGSFLSLSVHLPLTSINPCPKRPKPENAEIFSKNVFWLNKQNFRYLYLLL